MPLQPARAPSRDQRLVASVLAHLPLFRGASEKEAATMAARVWTTTARRGDIIVGREARLPGAFAVAHGTVKLVLRGPEGEGRVLRVVVAGQSFGEASALLGVAAGYEARAVSECTLVVLPMTSILELAQRDPRIAGNLSTLLAGRTMDLLAELQAATLQRSSQRLAGYLEALAAASTTSSGPTRVQLPLSKTLIASRLGVKKETLSRLLRQLSTQGVIEVGRRDIAILDRGRLAALVRSELT